MLPPRIVKSSKFVTVKYIMISSCLTHERHTVRPVYVNTVVNIKAISNDRP